MHTCEFTWNGSPGAEERASAEEAMEKDLDHVLHLFPACHPGPVKFSIARGGPLLESFDGSLACSCGRPLATIAGRFEKNQTTYERIAAPQ